MKNNKLIAEFMGVGKLYEAQSSNQWNQYHSDWNKLMPVVNKCMQTGENTDEWDALYDALSTVNKTNTHEAVVEFIKQYNENERLNNEYISHNDAPYGQD